jgi:NAD(P)H-flavin reductase
VPAVWRVRSRARETTDTWTLELEPAAGGEPPPFAPGQFNMIYAFGAGEVPISICGDPGEAGGLLHTVRAVGTVTEAICAAEPGDELGVRGPYGSSWPVAEAAGGQLVIVAGGLGLAPLRPAVLAALRGREQFDEVLLLYGGRQPDQLLYRDELASWGADPALRVGLTVDGASGDWAGEVGLVTKLIERADLDPDRVLAMLCGPEVMMRFAALALRDRGVAADRLYVSLERNMKCAVTHCGRCVFGPTYVCRDGPVMRLSDIEPFLAVREM